MRVAGETTWAHSPVLAWGASSYLVAWAEAADGGVQHSLNLLALDRGGLTIGGETDAVGPDPYIYPGEAAWSGSEFVVGFSDNLYGDFDAWGLRATAGGSSIGVEADVSGADNNETSVRVAWTGSSWGFSWIDSRASNRLYISDVHPVTLNNEFEDHITSGLGFIYGNHDVVWTGSTWGVCWGDNRDGTYQLYFKVVTALGTDVTPDTEVTGDFDEVNDCSIAWTGSRFAIGWTGEKAAGSAAAYLVAVEPDGSRASDDVFVGTVFAGSPGQPIQVAAAPGLGIGAAWARDTTHQQIVLSRYDLSLDPAGDPVLVSDLAPQNVAPSLAWDGSGFGVAWELYQGPGQGDVYFARVGCY
jgi:hypothetical protein